MPNEMSVELGLATLIPMFAHEHAGDRVRLLRDHARFMRAHTNFRRRYGWYSAAIIHELADLRRSIPPEGLTLNNLGELI